MMDLRKIKRRQLIVDSKFQFRFIRKIAF